MSPELRQISREARRSVSRRGPAALFLMLMPGFLFALGMVVVQNHPRYAWAAHISQYPWEFWVIAGFGSMATLGGVGDWMFHRSGETAVGKPEHRGHLLALGGGGLPLFLLMAVASIIAEPAALLVPVIVVAIVTVVLICYDEFAFHRRCAGLETALHRMLTLGNGIAWLAWTHWCFVRGSVHG